MHKTFNVQTQDKFNVIDITSQIEQAIEELGAQEGIAIVTTPHTTCSIILNESDSDLIEDLQNYAKKIADSGEFAHRHGPDPKHAASHILSSIFSQSQTIPLSAGQLLLGTWQRVSLFEFEGPREREVQLTIIATDANN
ncbi:YjbQ family protein [Candidatus Woesebacteria bacterium]|nr:YjbQ family protein [Candidatus Woesebacteria bacterium]